MKLSYDYEILIKELKEELHDGILTPSDKIQILRQKESVNGYKPIIDWFYLSDKPSIEDGLTVLMSVADCLKEMEELNRIV